MKRLFTVGLWKINLRIFYISVRNLRKYPKIYIMGESNGIDIKNYNISIYRK